MERLKHKPCTIVYEKKAVLNGCKVFEYTDIKEIKYPKPFMVKDKREKTKSLIKEHYMEIMCEYDEAFTVQEMLEETGQCKDCKLNCPNAGKMEDLYYMQFAHKVLDSVKLAESALDAEGYKVFLESVKRLVEQKLEKCN